MHNPKSSCCYTSQCYRPRVMPVICTNRRTISKNCCITVDNCKVPVDTDGEYSLISSNVPATNGDVKFKILKAATGSGITITPVGQCVLELSTDSADDPVPVYKYPLQLNALLGEDRQKIILESQGDDSSVTETLTVEFDRDSALNPLLPPPPSAGVNWTLQPAIGNVKSWLAPASGYYKLHYNVDVSISSVNAASINYTVEAILFDIEGIRSSVRKYKTATVEPGTEDEIVGDWIMELDEGAKLQINLTITVQTNPVVGKPAKATFVVSGFFNASRIDEILLG